MTYDYVMDPPSSPAATHRSTINEEIAFLRNQMAVARRELKNIRMSIKELKRLHQSSIKEIMAEIHKQNHKDAPNPPNYSPEEQLPVTDEINCKEPRWEMKPLGFIETSFHHKNATPRQSTICLNSTARLQMGKTFFSNPSHAMEGLLEYSHVWLIFIFHKNDKNSYIKGKVAPPRLDGRRIGVLSSRSPHRPNPIGLSLAKLDKINDNTLYFSGVDLVDGTPVIDIKPYIPIYDNPHCSLAVVASDDCGNRDALSYSANSGSTSEDGAKVSQQNNESCTPDMPYELHHQTTGSGLGTCVPPIQDVVIPNWITNPIVKPLNVLWTARAMQQLDAICSNGTSVDGTEASGNIQETLKIVNDVLREDPRSVYRRHRCKDQLYYFSYGILHLTCWIDDSDSSVEILKVTKLYET